MRCEDRAPLTLHCCKALRCGVWGGGVGASLAELWQPRKYAAAPTSCPGGGGDNSRKCSTAARRPRAEPLRFSPVASPSRGRGLHSVSEMRNGAFLKGFGRRPCRSNRPFSAGTERPSVVWERSSAPLHCTVNRLLHALSLARISFIGITRAQARVRCQTLRYSSFFPPQTMALKSSGIPTTRMAGGPGEPPPRWPPAFRGIGAMAAS